MIRRAARANRNGGFQPFRKAGGVPMKNDALEKGTAQQHYDPIAIDRNAFAGRRNVIKIFHAVAKVAPNRFETMEHQPREFHALKNADVFEAARKLRVDVITFDAEFVRRLRADAGFAPVAAETVEHQ